MYLKLGKKVEIRGHLPIRLSRRCIKQISASILPDLWNVLGVGLNGNYTFLVENRLG